MEAFNFPAGETHVKSSGSDYHYLPQGKVQYVKYSGNANDWLMQHMLLADVHKRRGVKELSAFLPYLPYGRQDRPTSEYEPFSLKVIGDFINQAGFERVYTLDAHSDVAYGCINNLVNIPPEQIWKSLKDKCADKILVIPDQGAAKRYKNIIPWFKAAFYTIKERDTNTGRVKIHDIVCNYTMMGQHLVVMDDICDGGATFIQLANALKEYGAEIDSELKLTLCVTHGIFSKGIWPLLKAGYTKIYTTDSFNPPTGEIDPVTMREVSYPMEVLNSLSILTEAYLC